jgi:hypothetical protein
MVVSEFQPEIWKRPNNIPKILLVRLRKVDPVKRIK